MKPCLNNLEKLEAGIFYSCPQNSKVSYRYFQILLQEARDCAGPHPREIRLYFLSVSSWLLACKKYKYAQPRGGVKNSEF